MSAPRVRRGHTTLRTTLVALLVGTVALMCVVISAVTHVSVSEQLSAQLDQQLSRAAARSGPSSDQGDHDGQGGPGAGKGSTEGSAPSSSPSADPSPDASPSADPSLGVDPTPSVGATSTAEGEDGAGSTGSGEFELHAVVRDGSVKQAAWRDKDGQLRAVVDVDALNQAIGEAEEDPGTGHPTGTVDLADLGTYRFVTTSAGDGTTIVTALPLGPMHSTLTRLDLTLLGASLAAVAITGIAGWLIVRRTMRPLEQVARLATDVAAMPLESGSVTLSERVPPARAQADTEVGAVGLALNRLLDNVEGALETRQQSEERMRRFIADASHELRTPLTAIRGYTEMLRMTEDLTDRGEQSVDRMDAQSRRMTSLVEDLLLLARLDDGAPRGDEEVDLGEIVMEAALDAQVTGPDHTWRLDVPDEPVTVRGDARQLTQVVVNLLSNARKHTPAGTQVLTRLRLEPAGGAAGGPAGGEEAVLTVADDGPGIRSDLLGEVFGRFTRADAARSGTDQTTGLGLPIVRAIAESHGGSIDVASTPAGPDGHGWTVFTLRLPALP